MYNGIEYDWTVSCTREGKPTPFKSSALLVRLEDYKKIETIKENARIDGRLDLRLKNLGIDPDGKIRLLTSSLTPVPPVVALYHFDTDSISIIEESWTEDNIKLSDLSSDSFSSCFRELLAAYMKNRGDANQAGEAIGTRRSAPNTDTSL